MIDPELIGDGPKDLRNTSGALFGKHIMKTPAKTTHARSNPTRVKTNFYLGTYSHNKRSSHFHFDWRAGQLPVF